MLSREDIEGLATLARLQLTDAEVAGLQTDASNILGYVETISSIEVASPVGVTDTTRVPVAPLHHNIMRADAPRASDDSLAGKEEQLRAAFPAREGDFNVVRKIIQKDE